jgi:DNA repair exonuclease SbcCD ATPase subunit
VKSVKELTLNYAPIPTPWKADPDQIDANFAELERDIIALRADRDRLAERVAALADAQKRDENMSSVKATQFTQADIDKAVAAALKKDRERCAEQVREFRRKTGHISEVTTLYKILDVYICRILNGDEVPSA